MLKATQPELVSLLDTAIIQLSRALLLSKLQLRGELGRTRRRGRRKEEEKMATLRRRNEELTEEREKALELLREMFACKVGERERERERERRMLEGRGSR